MIGRFANEDPVYGRDACRGQVQSVFTSVTGISHHIIEQWEHGDATITEAAVTFTLPDDALVTLPMVTIYRTNAECLIADYRVYVDSKRSGADAARRPLSSRRPLQEIVVRPGSRPWLVCTTIFEQVNPRPAQRSP